MSTHWSRRGTSAWTTGSSPVVTREENAGAVRCVRLRAAGQDVSCASREFRISSLRAKRSNPGAACAGKLDCFVAALLAMTRAHPPPLSGAGQEWRDPTMICFTSPRAGRGRGSEATEGEGPLRDSEWSGWATAPQILAARLRRAGEPLIPTFSPHAARRSARTRGDEVSARPGGRGEHYEAAAIDILALTPQRQSSRYASIVGQCSSKS